MNNRFFKSIGQWVDEHGLFALSLFLFVFIPLYPKLPLLEAIPGYLVRVRLEDLLVGITGIFWFVQFVRGKIVWWNRVTGMILLYSLIGLTSLLFAIFVLQSIPLQFIHIAKSALHYVRYLEYFAMFVFMYSGIKTKDHVTWFMRALGITVIAIVIYGVGQRYFGWPVFSTMNREYSKGQALQLTDLARVHSTFGGHYDLAAYLLIALPLLFTWMWWTKQKALKVGLAVVQVAGIWLLLASGAKVALLGYCAGLGLLSLVELRKYFGLKKTLLIGSSATLLISVSLLSALALFRPATFQKIRSLVDSSTNTQQSVPSDVIGRENETWSENAKKYGLSMGIRLDTLWPQALKGWTSNPWLGKGYATLNKQGRNEFTEADSTDNNYLRVLGETGIFGFITFFSIVLLILSTIRLEKQTTTAPLLLGLWGASLGLLVNGVIIDVFSASKVAFTYWAVAGAALKAQVLNHPSEMKALDTAWATTQLARLNKFAVLIVALAVAVLFTHKQPFSDRSLIQNIELSPQTLESIAFADCLVTRGALQTCRELSNISSIPEYAYAAYLVPWLKIYQHPSMYYFANLSLFLLGIIFLWRTLVYLNLPRWLQLTILGVLVSQPTLYQLPSQSSPANLLVPLFSVGVFLLTEKIAPRVRTKIAHIPQTGWLWGIPLVYLMALFIMPTTQSVIAHNYQDTYRPWRFQAVRRANLFLNTRKENAQPLLITAINPLYFTLYGTDEYAVTPLLPDSITTYERLLRSQPNVFITNADTQNSSSLATAFETIKQTFGIRLREIDCEFQCNVYELYPENEPLSSQPQSINEATLKTAPDEIITAMIVSQRFTSGVTKPPLTTVQASQQLANLSNRVQPDFMLLLGDAQHPQNNTTEEQFRNTFADRVSFPISYVSGNWDLSTPKTLVSEPRLFQINNTVFIVYHPGPNGEISLDLKLFLYNAFLQLEKHPEVHSVFLVTHRSNWLAGHPLEEKLSVGFLTHPLTEHDHFFAKEILPQIKAFPQKHFYVVSGDLQPLSHPAVVYQQAQQENVTYVATSLNHTSADTYLTIELHPTNPAELKAHTLSGTELDLSNYTLDYWVKEVEANVPSRK